MQVTSLAESAVISFTPKAVMSIDTPLITDCASVACSLSSFASAAFVKACKCILVESLTWDYTLALHLQLHVA